MKKIIAPQEVISVINFQDVKFDVDRPIGLEGSDDSKNFVVKAYNNQFTFRSLASLDVYQKESTISWYDALDDLLKTYLDLGLFNIYQFDSRKEFYTWLLK